MTNTLGRIAVVFIAAASLGFVAFAGAMRNGGRNWEAEADALREDFILNTTPGDIPSYSITHRRSGQNVSTSPILAEAVTKAWEKRAGETRDQLAKLNEQAEKLKPAIEAAQKATDDDEQGLKFREEALSKQLADVTAEISRINTQIISKGNEVQQIRIEGQDRREEAYRLRNQLELLRDDLYVAQVQRKNLEEEEIRLQDLLQRLERRQRQLSSRTADE